MYGSVIYSCGCKYGGINLGAGLYLILEGLGMNKVLEKWCRE
jgi:hypothetical protein